MTTKFRITFADLSTATVAGRSHLHACRRASRLYRKTVLDWKPIPPERRSA